MMQEIAKDAKAHLEQGQLEYSLHHQYSWLWFSNTKLNNNNNNNNNNNVRNTINSKYNMSAIIWNSPTDEKSIMDMKIHIQTPLSDTM